MQKQNAIFWLRASTKEVRCLITEKNKQGRALFQDRDKIPTTSCALYRNTTQGQIVHLKCFRCSHEMLVKLPETASHDPVDSESQSEAAPKATASGSGTADPNKLDPAQGNTPNEWTVIPEHEWKEFMTTSWEQIAKLDVAIFKLGKWIAPAAKHNLNILCDGLEDVEELWFNPNTGICYEKDRISVVENLFSVQKLFTRGVREIEKLVKAAQASRSETLTLFHPSTSHLNLLVQSQLLAKPVPTFDGKKHI